MKLGIAEARDNAVFRPCQYFPLTAKTQRDFNREDAKTQRDFNREDAKTQRDFNREDAKTQRVFFIASASSRENGSGGLSGTGITRKTKPSRLCVFAVPFHFASLRLRGSISLRVFAVVLTQIRSKLFAARGMAQTADGFFLDLSHTFACKIELLADFLECE